MEGVAKPRWNPEMVLAHDERLPSPWERLSARFIDQALVLGVSFLFLTPGLVLENAPLAVIGFLLYPFVLSIYEIVCVARWGQTLGKRIKGLRVARLRDGGNPSVLQSVVRLAVYGLAFWTAYSVLLNRTHRGPHDRAARTIVVYDSRV